MVPVDESWIDHDRNSFSDVDLQIEEEMIDQVL
jgi:hypothetical protein